MYIITCKHNPPSNSIWLCHPLLYNHHCSLNSLFLNLKTKVRYSSLLQMCLARLLKKITKIYIKKHEASVLERKWAWWGLWYWNALPKSRDCGKVDAIYTEVNPIPQELVCFRSTDAVLPNIQFSKRDKVFRSIM